ncbi:hypothetical protein [Xanthomarina sp.]|nr:hypothetical protein [Xanthomarina sp.]HLV38520.1 hypothetical protein [Xanthomarina sp.]
MKLVDKKIVLASPFMIIAINFGIAVFFWKYYWQMGFYTNHIN